ncbi:MAG: DUF1302 family protein [Micropepsaceae bacterium]
MTKFNVVRTGLLGSAAAFALVGAANAVEAEFGDVQITFDTTVSMGASMLTQDRNTQFLPEANGGPIDPRNNAALGGVVLPNGILVAPFSGAFGGVNQYSGNRAANNDGSMQTDDGRLNFDRGDLIGANVKANHDLIVTWQNYKIFARAVGFYDVVMNDKDVGARSQLTDQALGDVGRNYELLDLFISADYTLGDIPVNLRAGKQVINWGESTFILNGLNVFNPIDVGAFRRPGSEIKEALVPVNAVYGSVSLPADISLAAYYALDWESFEIDPSGTTFSGADVIASGTGVGGNFSQGELVSFLTSSPFSGLRRNCTAAAGSGTQFVQLNGLVNNPLLSAAGPDGNGLVECNDSVAVGNFISHTTPFPIGQHERFRLGFIDGSGGMPNLSGDGFTRSSTGVLERGNDIYAGDGGQYGFKLTAFAEDLGGTEFGFYYQNYHSRLPFVNIGADPTDTAADLGFFVNSFVSNIVPTDLAGSIQGRQLNNSGCGLTAPGLIGTINGGAAAATINAVIGGGLGNPLTAGTAANQMANTPVLDPGNVLPTAAAAVTALTGGVVALNPTNGFKNQLAIAQLNCVLTYFQSGLVVPPGTVDPTVQSFDGAEFLLAGGDGELVVSYPENIEVFGASFNTTIAGWGVQGEVSYRPDAPFQIDTDALTINALVAGCTFHQLYGAAGGALAASAQRDGDGVKPVCGANDRFQNGVRRNEMYTAQVGTTATFTGSDWFVDALGADLGVLVTEVGMVYVPGVEDTWTDNLSVADRGNIAQYANTGCQGTDLPLAGALGLDKKSSAQCRPDDFSAGLVMLLRMEYNNFMDTGFVVAPTLVYSWDMEGTTPSPYGNFSEDRQAVNLGVTGTLNNNFRVGVNYSNFFSGHVNNKNRDRDFASVNASYTF